MVRSALIQLISSENVEDNLSQVSKWLKKAYEQEVKLVLLPENFAHMGLEEKDKFGIAELYGLDPFKIS